MPYISPHLMLMVAPRFIPRRFDGRQPKTLLISTQDALYDMTKVTRWNCATRAGMSYQDVYAWSYGALRRYTINLHGSVESVRKSEIEVCLYPFHIPCPRPQSQLIWSRPSQSRTASHFPVLHLVSLGLSYWWIRSLRVYFRSVPQAVRYKELIGAWT